MRYRSTMKRAPVVSLRQAVLDGLAPDGGLYTPVDVPQLQRLEIEDIRGMSIAELSFQVIRPYVGKEISEQLLWQIIEQTVAFPIELVSLSEKLHVLELFHGPTLAFKDFGARFLARIMANFVWGGDKQLTVLVATSGDTGSAIAHAFLGVEGVRVVILYPSQRISSAQEKQFATLGNNVEALEVAGSFDDCQLLVKQALSDKQLQSSLLLTSANSINIGRLLPQMFYHAFSFAQTSGSAPAPLVVSVPSGNLGNLVAGMMVRKMGIPVGKFIASTNSNDTMPRYLQAGRFVARPSIVTISNAMDVGNPNNFARVVDLCEDRIECLREQVWGHSASDEETLKAMKRLYETFGYIADPHTAVGIVGLEAYKHQFQRHVQGVVLATAHPAKFSSVVERAIGIAPRLPARLAACLDRQNLSRTMSPSYKDFREYLYTL